MSDVQKEIDKELRDMKIGFLRQKQSLPLAFWTEKDLLNYIKLKNLK